MEFRLHLHLPDSARWHEASGGLDLLVCRKYSTIKELRNSCTRTGACNVDNDKDDKRQLVANRGGGEFKSTSGLDGEGLFVCSTLGVWDFDRGRVASPPASEERRSSGGAPICFV